ncbi:hypothetical protein MMC18_002376 [Xylographa bjoerkii]|nr:hypothetical protein [Xylographa bjoerkii]
MRKYVDAAWANFDWNGPAADADWEPHFGARVCRELVKWLRESGFHDKNLSLLQAVREEVATAYVTDLETGSRTLDVEKLVTLPLPQSIFAEVLRVRMNFNLMRNVNEHITMDGFTLQKGSML